MMGSSVFVGKLDHEQALDTEDDHGTSVRQALAEMGALGTDIGPRTAAYAEIHIEQGRILEAADMQIGLVESTWAAQKYRYIVHGEQSHTGATIMADRRDALYGAALIVVAAREIADEHCDPPVHTSVAHIRVEPNSPVVVAREVDLLLDLRSPDEETLLEADMQLQARLKTIEHIARIRIERTRTHSWGVLGFSPAAVSLAQSAAEELGLSYRPMVTIAGHDSVNLKDVVPTVMLFVPSAAGISHNEAEFTEDRDLCAGTNLLTRIAENLARGHLQGEFFSPM